MNIVLMIRSIVKAIVAFVLSFFKSASSMVGNAGTGTKTYGAKYSRPKRQDGEFSHNNDNRQKKEQCWTRYNEIVNFNGEGYPEVTLQKIHEMMAAKDQKDLDTCLRNHLMAMIIREGAGSLLEENKVAKLIREAVSGEDKERFIEIIAGDENRVLQVAALRGSVSVVEALLRVDAVKKDAQSLSIALNIVVEYKDDVVSCWGFVVMALLSVEQVKKDAWNMGTATDLIKVDIGCNCKGFIERLLPYIPDHKVDFLNTLGQFLCSRAAICQKKLHRNFDSIGALLKFSPAAYGPFYFKYMLYLFREVNEVNLVYLLNFFFNKYQDTVFGENGEMLLKRGEGDYFSFLDSYVNDVVYFDMPVLYHVIALSRASLFEALVKFKKVEQFVKKNPSLVVILALKNEQYGVEILSRVLENIDIKKVVLSDVLEKSSVLTDAMKELLKHDVIHNQSIRDDISSKAQYSDVLDYIQSLKNVKPVSSRELSCPVVGATALSTDSTDSTVESFGKRCR